MTTITGYHGTADHDLTAYIGLCITDDEIAAEHYAEGNAFGAQEPVVLLIDIDEDGLTVAEAEYDYDATEPVLDGVDADVVEYLDCDEHGRTHRTWMLLTAAAVAATAITA